MHLRVVVFLSPFAPVRYFCPFFEMEMMIPDLFWHNYLDLRIISNSKILNTWVKFNTIFSKKKEKVFITISSQELESIMYFLFSTQKFTLRSIMIGISSLSKEEILK